MLEVFLINVNTISNFIRCIKESKVINELDQNSNERIEFLNILLTKFDEYQLEKKLKFITIMKNVKIFVKKMKIMNLFLSIDYLLTIWE